jgi:hypothetical protein
LQPPYIAFHLNAGWSSLVARQAHNLKAAGSNPAPATTFFLGAFSFGGISPPKNAEESGLSTDKPE